MTVDSNARAAPGRDWQRAALALTALVLIGALYSMRLRLLETLTIDPDEFEHLHVAWCMANGLVPYRDFFEHHTPWLHFLIAPFFRFYAVACDPDAAIAFIFFARRIAMVLAGVAIALTFLLARLWRGEIAGWMSAVLLSTAVVFVHKTLEIRPDGLAMVLWLGALVAIVGALGDGQVSPRRNNALFALSGFMLGGAIMSTQKILVIMPSISLAMIWYLCAGTDRLNRRVAGVLCQFGGFCVALGATVAYFWAHGALRAFVEDNLILNLEWQSSFPRYFFVLQRFCENPVLMTLGAIGLVREIPATFRKLTFNADKLLMLATVGAMSGVYLLPEPWPQYYLTFVPLLCLYAAALLVFVAGKISGADRTASLPVEIAYAIALGLLCCSAIALSPIQVPHSAPVAFGVLLLAGIIVLFRAPVAGLVLLLIAFSVHPYQQMRMQFGETTDAIQLRKLRYVLSNTRPTDTVLDSWSGLGVFRPHAYFYFFVHGGILQFISSQARQQFAADLLSGKIAPTLMIPNENLLELTPMLNTIMQLDYMPVPFEFPIRRRKDEPLSPLMRNLLQPPAPASPGKQP
jgi:hypothetical protein